MPNLNVSIYHCKSYDVTIKLPSLIKYSLKLLVFFLPNLFNTLYHMPVLDLGDIGYFHKACE